MASPEPASTRCLEQSHSIASFGNRLYWEIPDEGIPIELVLNQEVGLTLSMIGK